MFFSSSGTPWGSWALSLRSTSLSRSSDGTLRLAWCAATPLCGRAPRRRRSARSPPRGSSPRCSRPTSSRALSLRSSAATSPSGRPCLPTPGCRSCRSRARRTSAARSASPSRAALAARSSSSAATTPSSSTRTATSTWPSALCSLAPSAPLGSAARRRAGFSSTTKSTTSSWPSSSKHTARSAPATRSLTACSWGRCTLRARSRSSRTESRPSRRRAARSSSAAM
eukprot:Amastigsp_a508540_93.p3 type:complete len:226 gc:universal Amastigsp_a508540_93:525-1202(+)